MPLRIHPINPHARDYPRPFAPPLPYGPGAAPVPDELVEVSDLRACGQYRHTRSGRAAIYLAAAILGLRPGDRVLLPAYHCATLIAPLLARGLEVEFFALDEQLYPDLDDLLPRLGQGATALLLIHYFGFPRIQPALVEALRRHQIKVIEDCAHAFFTAPGEGPRIGEVGDVLIASTRKFFSGPDGGLLVWRGDGPAPRLARPSLKAELRAVYHYLDDCARGEPQGRAGRLLGRIGRRQGVPRTAPAVGTAQVSGSVDEPDADALLRQWFDPATAGVAMSAIARWNIVRAQRQSMANTRRHHYRRLVAGIRTSRVHPLFPELPPGVVPYMVPALLEGGERDFDHLKRRGVPLWRWEELAHSHCSVSRDYRLRLVQIPCHQNLNEATLERIIGELNALV